MNFEIVGKLLERTASLAEKLQCEAEILLVEIYRKGLEIMEGVKPIRTKGLPPDEEIASFIRENWLSSSDEEMAQKLKHAPSTVRRYRLSMIKSYRMELASKYITEHPLEDTDVVIAKKFGLKTIDCMKLRLKLGFLKKRGPKGINSHELGTAEEIRYALTEGGYTIVSLVKAKGLDITRERGRQIIAEFGINGQSYLRKPLWYTHRLVGLDNTELARNLTDKDWVIKQLAESGGLNAFAAKLAVTVQKLKYYFEHHLELETNLVRSHGEMVEFRCSFDGKPIFRLKRVVEKEKITRPDKVTHFCNRICQGKYLGSHRRKNTKKSVKI